MKTRKDDELSREAGPEKTVPEKQGELLLQHSIPASDHQSPVA